MSGPPGQETGGSSLPPPKTDLPHGGYSGCSHEATRQVILGAGSFHYGRDDCKACGAFLSWIAKPANIERAGLNAMKLASLVCYAGLSSYQRKFVVGVRHLKHLTPRQQNFLDSIYGGYLEATARA